MPIDPMMLDAVLNTFKGMAKEIEEKGIEGEPTDKMNDSLNRMIELGEQLDDFNEYNGIVMQENLYGNFSDNYGKALSQGAGGGSGSKSGEYDDAALLTQTLNALKDAIKRIKDSKQEAIDQVHAVSNVDSAEIAIKALDDIASNSSSRRLKKFLKKKKKETMEEGIALDADEDLKKKNLELQEAEIEALFESELIIKPITELIQLGEEPGMTFPDFLRIQIEKGMDKAMEGSIVSRNAYVYDLNIAIASSVNPHNIDGRQRKIAAFDLLASKAKFDVPDSLEVTLAHDKIDWENHPKKDFWDELKERMFSIIDRVEEIIIANSKYYPSYMPYMLMTSNEAKKKHAEYVKNCVPGILKQEERLLEKYFGLKFEDIFNHEIFIWEVEKYHIDNSQIYTEYLKNVVYPECIPLQFLSSSTISIFENEFHDKNVMSNPETVKRREIIAKGYDDHFGEGYWLKKFGEIPPNTSLAPAWDLNTFK